MTKALIAHALFLKGWKYSQETAETRKLLRFGKPVLPEEFQESMAGSIFCPNCYTNVTRRPLNKERSSAGTLAFFAHIPTFKSIPCTQRTPASQGELFVNEEQASQAIVRGELVMFSGFVDEPTTMNEQALPFTNAQIEDPTGPLTEVPIARHTGDPFLVPARNRTIYSICRNFDQNIKKYYQFPEQAHPALLSDQLHDVLDVQGEDETPKLFFGEIRSVDVKSIQMLVWLNSGPHIKDFALPAKKEQHMKRGIGKDSVGTFVLFWGTVRDYGIGYCTRLKWGEYGLLPTQYNSILVDLRAQRSKEQKAKASQK